MGAYRALLERGDFSMHYSWVNQPSAWFGGCNITLFFAACLLCTSSA
jgi:hypothetical protein